MRCIQRIVISLVEPQGDCIWLFPLKENRTFSLRVFNGIGWVPLLPDFSIENILLYIKDLNSKYSKLEVKLDETASKILSSDELKSVIDNEVSTLKLDYVYNIIREDNKYTFYYRQTNNEIQEEKTISIILPNIELTKDNSETYKLSTTTSDGTTETTNVIGIIEVPRYEIEKTDDNIYNLVKYIGEEKTIINVPINIPKDLVVKEGYVVEYISGIEYKDDVATGITSETRDGKYIKLVINNEEVEPIYIAFDDLNVKELKDGEHSTINDSNEINVSNFIPQYNDLSSALDSELLVQYTGETTSTLTKGYFYYRSDKDSEFKQINVQPKENGNDYRYRINIGDNSSVTYDKIANNPYIVLNQIDGSKSSDEEGYITNISNIQLKGNGCVISNNSSNLNELDINVEYKLYAGNKNIPPYAGNQSSKNGYCAITYCNEYSYTDGAPTMGGYVYIVGDNGINVTSNSNGVITISADKNEFTKTNKLNLTTTSTSTSNANTNNSNTYLTISHSGDTSASSYMQVTGTNGIEVSAIGNKLTINNTKYLRREILYIIYNTSTGYSCYRDEDNSNIMLWDGTYKQAISGKNIHRLRLSKNPSLVSMIAYPQLELSTKIVGYAYHTYVHPCIDTDNRYIIVRGQLGTSMEDHFSIRVDLIYFG